MKPKERETDQRKSTSIEDFREKGVKFLKTLRQKLNKEKVGQLFQSGKITDVIKKVADFTIEGSKVLSIRAQEAGRLTKLNAQKFKLKRDHHAVCAEIGGLAIETSATGSKADILSSPKVRELVEKAGQIERDIKLLDEEIEYYKKECESKVRQIHKKAA